MTANTINQVEALASHARTMSECHEPGLALGTYERIATIMRANNEPALAEHYTGLATYQRTLIR